MKKNRIAWAVVAALVIILVGLFRKGDQQAETAKSQPTAAIAVGAPNGAPSTGGVVTATLVVKPVMK